MWVQLRSLQFITIHGVPTNFYPGDWVDVGRQTAMLWVSRGEAVVPSGDYAIGNAGAVVPFGSGAQAGSFLAPFKMQVVEGDPQLAFERTVIWDTLLGISREFIPMGLSFLSTWQVAVPLWKYDELAVHVGSDEDRERTRAVIHDLRVPLYDIRLMFLLRCPETEELIKLYLEERQHGDARLAFLRSLYQVKPLVLALPVTWTDRTSPR